MALPVGTVIAGYRIEQVLGSGGMGTVYLAADPVLPRPIGLKVLKADLGDDDSFRRRFLREADLIAALTHPSVVAVYTRGATAEGRLWIAMQYVDGTDADDEVEAGRMSVERALHITAEIAGALDYAHSRGIIHRDVKPANFLLEDRDRRVYLADFGIARGGEHSTQLTGADAFLGTISYSAPEMFSGETIDGRADIYSLGCSLYRMLTGRRVFDSADNPAALMAAHLTAPPPRPTDAVPELPAAIDEVIARALAKEPADRYRTAGEFAAAARAALTGTPDAAESDGAAADAAPGEPAPAEPAAPEPDPASPVSRRRRPLLAAAAVAVVAAVTAAGLIGWRATHPDPPRFLVDPGADPALMDTGPYRIVPEPPDPATAGERGPWFEGLRLAGSVLGPWQVTPALHDYGAEPDQLVDPIDKPAAMRTVQSPAAADLAGRHRLVTGFSTWRVATDEVTENPDRLVMLSNVVLRFTEPADAAAFVAESTTAEVVPVVLQRLLREIRPATVAVRPDTRAFQGWHGDTPALATATAHGDYALLVSADATAELPVLAKQLASVIDEQIAMLDAFQPTAVADLAGLPRDPSGELLGRTLRPIYKKVPAFGLGVYPPAVRLHFEPNPVRAAAVFETAGVRWVSHALGTVYQTASADGAVAVAAMFADEYTGTADVAPVPDGVPGLPVARCFERTRGYASRTDPLSWQSTNWHYSCVGHVDRYAFTVTSTSAADVKQRAAAQYRLLTADR